MTEVPEFFHGGCPGLNVNDLVLPASKIGTLSVSGAKGAPYSPDLVYMTTDLEAARSYAGLYASPKAMRAQAAGRMPALRELSYGDVYRVEPLGSIERDRDYVEPGVSFQTTMAKVVAVIERGIPPTDVDPRLAEMLALAHKREKQAGHSQVTPGRNDPCHCGSGRKYKKCCGR